MAGTIQHCIRSDTSTAHNEACRREETQYICTAQLCTRASTLLQMARSYPATQKKNQLVKNMVENMLGSL